MWVFGYGSLIWKADFPFKTKLVGYIKGYKRRFYQHSVDHRGRPNKPGRVVTLVPSHSEDSVWGVAYEIHKHDENYVISHLDYREKTGYKKQCVTFYPTKEIGHYQSAGDGEQGTTNTNVTSRDPSPSLKLEPFQLMIYIGTEDNQWYAGAASVEDIAKQIFESEGPSGTNKEYLYNLAAAMRTMAPHVNDEHLFALEKAVQNLEHVKSKEKSQSAPTQAQHK
ncbi:hypothetical protein RUM43_013730 [Polyplax serrata]|uniref:glutathione-specific gamma-glutamylcyclotransferase n=1 Tax=Polyplax serrata TaxID=468196 RepID=A0AAN8PIK0_POLSC